MEGPDRDREAESVMVVTTPRSRGVRSRKRKRETEELNSPSADAVSEKHLKETAPMILACQQKGMGRKKMKRRIFAVILNVYQSTGIEKEDGSRQSLENHGNFDEIRRFYNKMLEEGHDVHRNLATTEGYSRPNNRGEYQYVSGVMGIAYNPFLDSEGGSAHRNYGVTELLKFWTEKIIEVDPVKRERPSLGLILEKMPKVISVPRSNKRVELKMGKGNGMLITKLRTV